jgi:two-component system, chemotaxis family, protein-glutamate methylesterase/glutaminase
MNHEIRFKAVVIGASAGGVHALGEILPRLPKNYPLPIIIVLHLPGDQPSLLAEIFGSKTELRVKDADEKESLQPGTIYFACPGYHLLVERDLTLSLSQEDPVQYARPSIDVLFESAAVVLGRHLVGVLLTGANQDGAEGLKRIQEAGGLALIQDPATAQVRAMPEAACALLSPSVEQILSLDEIARFLLGLKGDDGSSED